MINLYNGDCLEILKKFEDNSIDLVVVDPPYLIETQGAGLYKRKEGEYIKELNSMKNGFSETVLDELCRVMKKINIYIFCSQKQIIPLLDYFVKNKKCNYNLLCWHKTNPIPACCNKYLNDTEYILFFREKGVKIYGTCQTKKTYFVTPTNKEDKKKYNHPTVKPVNIIEKLIINSSNENDKVLDCFMGSGSTGVACINTNRKFIGIELDDTFFNVAEKRIKEAQCIQ